MPSLKKLPRDELNAKAARLGIEDAEQMGKRADVIQAIEAAQLVEQHAGIWSRGARAVSVFGKGKNRQVLVEMSVEVAQEVFEGLPLHQAGPSEVVDAIKQELDEIRKRKPDVADSALAAGAVRMAYELDHPYNSATAKSYCVKALHAAMDRLRELAPPEEDEGGRLSELRRKREAKKETRGRSAA